MTFERQFCCRCTNIHYCILVGKKFYCEPCFDEMNNDPQQKKQIEKIMIECGIEDLEWSLPVRPATWFFIEWRTWKHTKEIFMPLIFKVQVQKKGHATCSKCGKFVSKQVATRYRFCPHCSERLWNDITPGEWNINTIMIVVLQTAIMIQWYWFNYQFIHSLGSVVCTTWEI